MSSTTTSLEIHAAATEDCQPALRLAFSGQAAGNWAEQAASLLSAARAGKLSLNGLLEARRGGQLVGAVWVNVFPGRMASVAAPQLIEGEPESTAEQLQQAAGRYMASHGICVAQSLLEIDHGADADRLRRGGFRHSADLLYLTCLAEHFPTAPQAGQLIFEPYSPAGSDRMGQIIQQTYQGTLDCPQLDGVRQHDDILHGYQHTGVFHCENWLFVRKNDEDIGCLLLADHPEVDMFELVYMGLTPRQRGQGLGLDITRQALWLAGHQGRGRMTLAVDAGNEPAINMYAAAGFKIWDRRSVFLKVL